MGEAAHRRALLDGRGLVVGVDLDDVAEGVELVAVVVAAVGRGADLADVPALVLVVRTAGFPAVTAGRALLALVAVERGDTLVAAGRVVAGRAGEVALEVLFAGQQRAPGGVAGTAVVDGAARAGAGGRVQRLRERVAAHCARQFHRRERRDAAVVGRVLDVGPAATGLADLDHRHAVGRDLLVGFRCRTRTRRAAVHMQVVVAQCLVVHRQQAALGAVRVARGAGSVEPEVLHAVVVVAGALVEIGVAAVVGIGWRTRRQRIAECVDHGGGVAGRHAHGVGGALGHGGEAQLVDRRVRGWRVVVVPATAGADAQPAQHHGRRGPHAAAQHGAPAQPGVEHGHEVVVATGVAVLVISIDAEQGEIDSLIHVCVPCDCWVAGRAGMATPGSRRR